MKDQVANPAESGADLQSYLSHGYFAQLTHAPWKRFVEIGEGTHMVMMEKHRMQLFRELAAFLEESDPLITDWPHPAAQTVGDRGKSSGQ